MEAEEQAEKARAKQSEAEELRQHADEIDPDTETARRSGRARRERSSQRALSTEELRVGDRPTDDESIAHLGGEVAIARVRQHAERIERLREEAAR